jgi:dihydroorotase
MAKPPTRRAFLARVAAGLSGLAVPSLTFPSQALSSPAGSAPRRVASSGPVRPGEPPWDLLIQGATVVDPASGLEAPRDVAVHRGRIARVAPSIPPADARQLLEAPGRILTPGLVDAHTHIYPGVAAFGIEPDQVGVARGVTTLVDGGSAGATTLPGFRAYVARPARTRVLALLNLSRPGMTVPNETADLAWLDPAVAAETVERNRDLVVGIKVRMLAGIPEGQDLEVMRRAREAGDRASVPVMVHIGGQTSPLPRILELLRPGDVVTHALRRQGSILDGNGRVLPEVREAVARGVHLDVGHGRGNLDFDVAEEALQQGMAPTIISSDVHLGNAAGPVFDLPTTLSKFLGMGMSLSEVIRSATQVPAAVFGLEAGLGTMAEGAPADLALFDLVEGDHAFEDSGGKRRVWTRRLVPWVTLRDGVPWGSLQAG